MPKDRLRLFSINRPELQTAMDTSTSQNITDPIVPAKCPKTCSDSISPTVSEQLHVLTTQVDQLRVTSEQAFETDKASNSNLPVI